MRSKSWPDNRRHSSSDVCSTTALFKLVVWVSVGGRLATSKNWIMLVSMLFKELCIDKSGRSITTCQEFRIRGLCGDAFSPARRYDLSTLQVKTYLDDSISRANNMTDWVLLPCFVPNDLALSRSARGKCICRRDKAGRHITVGYFFFKK